MGHEGAPCHAGGARRPHSHRWSTLGTRHDAVLLGPEVEALADLTPPTLSSTDSRSRGFGLLGNTPSPSPTETQSLPGAVAGRAVGLRDHQPVSCPYSASRCADLLLQGTEFCPAPLSSVLASTRGSHLGAESWNLPSWAEGHRAGETGPRFVLGQLPGPSSPGPPHDSSPGPGGG